MASPAQIEANRRNGSLSTGPRTDLGKAASSGNAIKHGLRAQRILLPDEDPDEFAEFRDDLLSEYAPATVRETFLADRIVTISWRLRRVPGIEVSVLARHAYIARLKRAEREARTAAEDPLLRLSQADSMSADDRAPHDSTPHAVRAARELAASEEIGAAVITDVNTGNALIKLNRYESELQRNLSRLEEDFDRLKARRTTGSAPRPIRDAELMEDDSDYLDDGDVPAPAPS